MNSLGFLRRSNSIDVDLLVGAIGVVIQDLQASAQQFVASIVNDEDTARIWPRANEDPDQLSDDERVRFFSLAMRQLC